jgi:uncharacterized protein (UPF0332 family)
VLLQLGSRFTKHAGVRAALHKDLVHTGRLATDGGEFYDRLYKSRFEADLLRSINAAIKKSQNVAAQKMASVMPGL